MLQTVTELRPFAHGSGSTSAPGLCPAPAGFACFGASVCLCLCAYFSFARVAAYVLPLRRTVHGVDPSISRDPTRTAPYFNTADKDALEKASRTRGSKR